MDFVIDDTTPVEVTHPTGFSRGYVPRDWTAHPLGSYPTCKALPTKIIPRDEWPDRIREKMLTKSALSDIRRRSGPGGGRIPSLDQDGIGYCWNHSVTMAIMLARAKAGLPYVRLSAFMIGCLIKHYQDQGGWGAQALDFVADNGVPSVEFWPEKSMNRGNDTPAMRANAALHKSVEIWADLTAPQYDRNMSEDQEITCLLNNDPLVGDFNWWSHSVCLMDAVLAGGSEAKSLPDLGSLDFNDSREFGVYAAVINKKGINSWTDQYGDFGEFTLSGSKARTNGAVAICTTLPSSN